MTMSHYAHAITCTKGNTDDDTDDAGARSMSANIASYWYCSPMMPKWMLVW